MQLAVESEGPRAGGCRDRETWVVGVDRGARGHREASAEVDDGGVRVIGIERERGAGAEIHRAVVSPEDARAGVAAGLGRRDVGEGIHGAVDTGVQLDGAAVVDVEDSSFLGEDSGVTSRAEAAEDKAAAVVDGETAGAALHRELILEIHRATAGDLQAAASELRVILIEIADGQHGAIRHGGGAAPFPDAPAPGVGGSLELHAARSRKGAAALLEGRGSGGCIDAGGASRKGEAADRGLAIQSEAAALNRRGAAGAVECTGEGDRAAVGDV